MPKESNAKNLNVFSEVIKSLTIDAVAEVEGINLLESKRSSARNSVSVYFLPNEKVAVDVFVNIDHGYTVPTAVAAAQEKVRDEIEGATKFRVQSVNVQIVSVNINQ